MLVIGVALAALSGAGAVALVPGTSDLRIFKTDSPDPVHVGEALTYSIVVENFGPLAATGVTVTDFLPDDVDFVSAKASFGACQERGRRVTCDLGGIGHGIVNYGVVNYGGPKTVTIVVVPRRAGTITNRALVKGEQPDPNGGNDEATATTRVIAPEICRGVAATLTGTAGDDVLEGTAGPDVIATLGGADVVRSLTGDDLVCAGAGSDTVDGGPGADRVFVEPGRDRVIGGRGRDDIRGDAGRDVLMGNRGPDRLRGGAGRDQCNGGPGKDSVRGCER
ncbi:MAG TPA: hypothetical protein VF081_11870 [Solirubrobacterales bacterium]